MENFKEQLSEIKKYLADRKVLKELASRAGVEIRTVHFTFAKESYDEVKGIHLKVYEEAIKMVDEIKSLPALAAEVLSK